VTVVLHSRKPLFPTVRPGDLFDYLTIRVVNGLSRRMRSTRVSIR
jgi:sorbitol-specific phosphotransferase system component IIC